MPALPTSLALSREGEESLSLKRQNTLKWSPFKTHFYINWRLANERDTENVAIDLISEWQTKDCNYMIKTRLHIDMS